MNSDMTSTLCLLVAWAEWRIRASYTLAFGDAVATEDAHVDAIAVLVKDNHLVIDTDDASMRASRVLNRSLLDFAAVRRDAGNLDRNHAAGVRRFGYVVQRLALPGDGLVDRQDHLLRPGQAAGRVAPLLAV